MLYRVPKRSGLRLAGRSWLLASSGAALTLLGLPAAALAQIPQASAPSTEPVPSREALELSAALSRLSREPRNVDALVDAGVAASKLGDFEAAVGFFRRGQALAPTNPRLLAGLAGALVRQGDAASAVPLFAQAQAAGAPAQTLAADRGLAHDLIGDPQSAQRFYAQALAAGSDVDEVTRRLAISQAISGDAAAMEKTLLPLLKKQDKPAWRARAFGLAILGQDKEASRIVKTLLPGTLANGITPYLQYMPRLTRAQQAAAANLGVFPRASEIGRDEARIAALAPPAAGRDAGKGLVPAGKPLGRDAAKQTGATALSPREARQQAREAEAKARRDARLAEEQKKREARVAQSERRERRVAPPEPKPAREDAAPPEAAFSVTREAPVPKVAEILDGKVRPETPAPSAPPPSTPVQTAPPQAAEPQVSAVLAAAAPPAQAPDVAASAPARAPEGVTSPAPTSGAAPGFDLARLPASSASAPAPVPAPAPAPSPAPAPVQASAAPAPAPPAAASEPVHSFGALFADLGKPTTVVDPAAGSVDIRKIKPARPKPKPKPEPEPEAKKPVPSHPSRIWVQLGIGQKTSALSQDWRRMEKASSALFKGRKPYSARLNQTNRLLTGPFASKREADAFIADLRKAGMSGPYIWISPAGEVVDELSR